jgi:hypothetical protein
MEVIEQEGTRQRSHTELVINREIKMEVINPEDI